MNPTIEMDLPEDSIFRKLGNAIIPETTISAPNGIKEVESSLSDEDYNKMISDFLSKARIEAEPLPAVTNHQKIKTIREQLADGRKPLKFRKGFLNSSGGISKS
tara:strand:- start:38 stop:349 length:312 start_codon:yes stop_codon:yes gene_type:complete